MVAKKVRDGVLAAICHFVGQEKNEECVVEHVVVKDTYAGALDQVLSFLCDKHENEEAEFLGDAQELVNIAKNKGSGTLTKIPVPLQNLRRADKERKANGDKQSRSSLLGHLMRTLVT